MIAENLSAAYGKKIILRKLNFDISQSKRTVITGKNGSGKSTLIKLLAGLKRPYEGRVIRNGNVAVAAPFLNFYASLSVRENFVFALGKKRAEMSAFALCEQFALEELEKSFASLSSGMQQKAKLVLAFSTAAECILLDEPGLSLDMLSKKLLYQLIDESKKTLVIATNDDAEKDLCTRELSLDAIS